MLMQYFDSMYESSKGRDIVRSFSGDTQYEELMFAIINNSDNNSNGQECSLCARCIGITI